MKAAEINPPPLPPVAAASDRRTDEARRSQSAATTAPGHGRRALLWLALLLGLTVLARIALHHQLPLPACPLRETTGVPCPLRETTGVPCPLCGGTRAFASLARLDFAEALRLNPLVCLAACGAGTLGLLALVRGERPMVRVKQRFAGERLWLCVLAVALLLNWFYLLFHPPH